jgi:hypothetical protein
MSYSKTSSLSFVQTKSLKKTSANETGANRLSYSHNLAREIEKALAGIVGLKLSLATNTGNMRRFHFGDLERYGRGISGQYALHLACPWRLERGTVLVTGSGDYYLPANEHVAFDADANGGRDSLQDKKLLEVLQGHDSALDVLLNETDQLIVAAIEGDSFGGIRIDLSGNYRLQIFPSSSRGQLWRFLPPDPEKHLVVLDGVLVRD